MKEKKLKVFEIVGGELETVSHYSNISALRLYCNLTGIDLVEFSDTDEIREIPESEFESRKFHLEGHGEITIAEYLKTHKEPEFICSTCF